MRKSVLSVIIIFITLRRFVVALTSAHFHGTKPTLRFCVGSNPARGASEICNGKNF